MAAVCLSEESVIQYAGFDESHEPAVGDLYTVKADGSTTFRRMPADPWIIITNGCLWVTTTKVSTLRRRRRDRDNGLLSTTSISVVSGKRAIGKNTLSQD